MSRITATITWIDAFEEPPENEGSYPVWYQYVYRGEKELRLIRGFGVMFYSKIRGEWGPWEYPETLKIVTHYGVAVQDPADLHVKLAGEIDER